jgi:hypothetical protein
MARAKKKPAPKTPVYTFVGARPIYITLKGGQELALIPGKDYTLPEKNSYIRGLIKQHYFKIKE